VSYASGAALVMTDLPQAAPLAEVLASARPRHAQTYAISLSEPGRHRNPLECELSLAARRHCDEIAPFAENAALPFLNAGSDSLFTSRATDRGPGGIA